MLLIDSDVLIDVLRGHPPAIEWFSGLSEIPSVPGFVVMELIQGSSDARQVRQVLSLVAPFSVVWPTAVDCNRALTDFQTLHLSHRLGLLDSLIAACAIGLSATLLTFNAKHYQPVPGITIQQPYRR